MARSARDCALMLAALVGDDDRVGSLAAGADPPSGDLAGVRIGFDALSRWSGGGEDPAFAAVFAAALDALSDLGAVLVPVELPYYEPVTAAGHVILVSEALAYHLPDLRTRWPDYFAGTRTFVASGAFFTGADYVQAQRVRGVGMRALAAMFEDVGLDLIVTPPASCGATRLEELDALAELMASGGPGPVYTPYWDVMGAPTLAVPIGFTADAMPLGMQLTGRPFGESLVLRAGEAFQRVTDWHLRRGGERRTDG